MSRPTSETGRPLIAPLRQKSASQYQGPLDERPCVFCARGSGGFERGVLVGPEPVVVPEWVVAQPAVTEVGDVDDLVHGSLGAPPS